MCMCIAVVAVDEIKKQIYFWVVKCSEWGSLFVEKNYAYDGAYMRRKPFGLHDKNELMCVPRCVSFQGVFNELLYV